MSNKVLVIGAINIDLFATVTDSINLEDSNPAIINIGYGGVGGNIASNLSRCGIDTHFLTVLGDDYFQEGIDKHYQSLGISLSESIVLKNTRSNIYLAIMDQTHDLFLGLNDMELINHLTLDVLKTKHDYIDQFDYLVIDNNLTIDALSYLLKTFQHKTIFIDAVSASKAPKLQNMFQYINVLKVNHLELSVLSDKPDLASKMTDLLSRGIETLIVTNKDLDIHLQTNTSRLTVKPIRIDNIINASGAGDAFISGYIFGRINGKTDIESLNDAKKLAHLTLQVKESTNEKVNLNE